jgi:hypothetical protein
VEVYISSRYFHIIVSFTTAVIATKKNECVMVNIWQTRVESEVMFVKKRNQELCEATNRSCIWCIPWHNSRQTLPSRSVLSKCHTVSWRMRKCNLIYAHKRSIAFPVPIFSKFTISQQHLVENYTELFPDRSRVDFRLWPQVMYDCHWANFMKFTLARKFKKKDATQRITWKSETRFNRWYYI